MAYKTITKLDEYIKQYREQVLKNEQRDITIKEVMEEIAKFADISWTSVKQMKNKDMQPSLAVALKVAEFFNVKVEDIWQTEYVENPVIDKKDTVKKVEKKEKPICKHENCTSRAIARGLCNKHYQQERNSNPSQFKKESHDICTEKDCTNPHYAKGLCNYHYNKFYREMREGK